LFCVELEKSLREIEDYLNEMPDGIAEFDFDETPHYSPDHSASMDSDSDYSSCGQNLVTIVVKRQIFHHLLAPSRVQ
jgi:hypothetical protein